MKKYFDVLDKSSITVMAVTLILFILALFTKGMTHDILLEAGVFLVSVKLIITTYKLSVSTAKIQNRIDQVYDIVREKE